MKNTIRLTLISILLISIFSSIPAQSVRAAAIWIFTNTEDSGVQHSPIVNAYRSGNISAFSPALAMAGALDTTFGADGKVTTDFGSDDVGEDVAIQLDGKIVMAGSYHNGANTDFALARFNSDGSLDTTFGTDGKVTTDFGGSYDNASAIANQSNGKIVMAGNSASDFALARYNSDGALDTTFGTDGKVTTAIGSSYDNSYAIAIQSDGKIIVAGDSYTDIGPDYSNFALVRYNSDGSLDTTFDNDGKVTTDFRVVDYGRAVVLQPDGKIVMAGTTDSGGNMDFALARYNSDGTLDTTFDSDGKVTTDIGSGDLGYDIVIQPDGRIVMIGSSNNGATLVRYNTNGLLDTTFDSDGKVTTDFGGDDLGRAIALQPNGKIIVAGFSYDGSNFDFALARYTSDGSLDTTFGTDGKVTTDFGSHYDPGRAVTIQPDGKIVMAGESYNGSNVDFALARYIGNSIITVTKTADTNDGTCDSDCSLREAIANASNGDMIMFDDSLAGQTIRLSSELMIDKSVAISGTNLIPHIKISGDTDNDGDGDVQLMTITSSSDVSFHSLDFINGYTGVSLSSGGINNFGSLAIYTSTFFGNIGDQGGAIRNSGELVVWGGEFNNNSAKEGGAILNDIGAAANITNAKFNQNSSISLYGSGGAIGNTGNLIVDTGEFNENTASAGGGAIVNAMGGTAMLSEIALSSNATDGLGGAIYNDQGILTISDSMFYLNSALSHGGAIYNKDQLSVSNTNFISNTTTAGGGIYNEGKLTITNSTIDHNSAASQGGGIFNFANATLTVTNTTFSDNSATYYGGGISNNGILTITNSIFSGNSTASRDGGAIESYGTLTITNSTFYNNSAAYDGGAIANGGTLTITNSTFFNNSANNAGGGIYNGGFGSSLTVTNSTFPVILLHRGHGAAVASRATPVLL